MLIQSVSSKQKMLKDLPAAFDRQPIWLADDLKEMMVVHKAE